MTVYDELGTYAGDLATWAVEREEPWTPEALALEIYVRRYVSTREDLARYRFGVMADVAFVPRDTRAAGDAALGERIVLSRLRSAVAALGSLTWETFNEVAIAIESSEDARQAKRDRLEAP